MKVLIGVDGSAGGFAAVRLAGQLLSPQTDQVALYYTPPQIRVSAGSETAPEMAKRAQQAVADALFDEAHNELPPELAATVNVIVGTRNPRQGIVVAAEEWRADLIAIGARGSGPIAKLLLGSVADSVVRSSAIPVLVARPRPAERADSPLRVLLATDGSKASQQAAAVLQRFTWPPGTIGRAMTVIESLLVGTVPQWLEQKARDADSEAMAQAWIDEHEAEKREKQEELSRHCQQLPAPFQNSPPIVAEGHAAEQILQTIAVERADLVVLGAHGKGALGRLLIGSTSDKVLSQAPCSVLIVRERPKP